MSYTITVLEKANYLHATVTGKNSPENVRDYLRDVLAACKKSTCPFVLIEENLSGPSLSVDEVFKIVSINTAGILPFIHCIAFVDTNPEHIAARMKFASTVASIQGLTVRLFKTVEDGENWMREMAKAGRPQI